MEVLVGPTFVIDASHAAAYDIIQKESPAHVRDVAQDKAAGGGDHFLEEGKNRSGEESPESSSSIGAPTDSSNEEDEDVVSSDGGLGSLNTLQDCLPIKRGLSNHYKGRSKSFLNLSEVSGVKDLEKTENPFNKRQRILMANKWSRKSISSSPSSSFYSWQNPKSTPLLCLQEEDEDGNVPDSNSVEDDDDDVCRPSSTSFSSSSSSSPWSSPMRPKLNLQSRKLVKSDLKYRSCFSLTDLQEEN